MLRHRRLVSVQVLSGCSGPDDEQPYRSVTALDPDSLSYGVHISRLVTVWRTPWMRTLAVLLFTQVVSEIAFSFVLPFTPLFLKELGVRDDAEAGLWTGAMAGTFAVTMSVMGPIWGHVADRYGRKLMIQRALFAGVVIVGALALVQSPEQFVVLRTIQGGFTGVVAALATVVSVTVPRRHLATALGMMQAGMFLGSSLGPAVGGLFSDQFGYRAAFVATAALFLVNGLLVTLLVREPAREPVAVQVVGEPAPTTSGGRFGGREMMVVVVLTAVIRFAQTAPQPVLPLFVESLSDAPTQIATTVGLVLAVFGVASSASALVAGRLADRYGRRATLITCLMLATLLTPLHAWVGTVNQMMLLRAAVGLAMGGMTPVIQALLTDMTPPGRRGAAFGMLATASAIGMGGGPVVGSAVAAGFGFPAAFLITTPVFIAAAWLVLRLPKVGRAA